MNIVSRLEGESLLEYAKRLPIGIKSGGAMQEEDVTKPKQTLPNGKVLRWGLFLIFIGLGFFSANHFAGAYNSHSEEYSMIVMGWIVCCGGLGLVISFIVERYLFKKEE